MPKDSGMKGQHKKNVFRIERAPLVSIALVIMFFVFISVFSSEKTLIVLQMPPQGVVMPPKDANNLFTVIVSKGGRVYYYENKLGAETVLTSGGLEDLRYCLAKKNRPVTDKVHRYYAFRRKMPVSDSIMNIDIRRLQDDSRGVFVLVKFDSLAKYKDVVGVIDEIEIASVPKGKYVIVKKLESQEREMLKEEYK